MDFLRDKKEDCCCICLDVSPDIANLCCGCACHFRCLRKWAESAGGLVQIEVACPMCRYPFTSKITTFTPPGPMPTPILQSSPSPMLNNARFVPILRSPPPMGAFVDPLHQNQNNEIRMNQNNQTVTEMQSSFRTLWEKLTVVVRKTPKTLMILLLLLYITFASALVFTYLRECKLYSAHGDAKSVEIKPVLTRHNVIEAVLYTLSAAMIIEMTKAVISSSQEL